MIMGERRDSSGHRQLLDLPNQPTRDGQPATWRTWMHNDGDNRTDVSKSWAET